jgi:hypothetical protein
MVADVGGVGIAILVAVVVGDLAVVFLISRPKTHRVPCRVTELVGWGWPHSTCARRGRIPRSDPR